VKKIFCCPGFEALISNAGKRGVAVIVVWRKPGGLKFLLQSRGIAHDDEALFKPMPLPLYINISSTVGLRYCPSCGKRLQELVDSAPEEFTELAKIHKDFESVADI